MRTLRLLLVDDHAMLREGLRALMAGLPDMEIVGEAADGLAAVKLAQRLLPDLVLMDVSLPKLDGVEATRQLIARCPQVRVIAFTAHESTVVLNQMREAGACGYVSKTASREMILSAIRRVASGGDHFDSELMKQAGGRSITALEPVTDLSPRETEVLRLLARGYLGKEVAAQLNVSPKSVETYKARLMVKLGLNSRVELVAYAQMKYPGDRL